MTNYTQAFIYGRDAWAGRLARHKKNCTQEELAAGAGHAGWVVVLEIRTGEYNELDADSEDHANRLAQSWVDHGHCQTAAVQVVRADGSLKQVRIVA